MSDIYLNIMRGNSESSKFVEYKVPFVKGMTVLDALLYIKDHIDPTLAFRYSCRMEICGSCAVMVNDKPRTACSTQIETLKTDHIKVEPLSGFKWEKDLIVDFQPFYDKHESVIPTLIRKDHVEGELIQSPKQLAKYRQFSLCIKCGVCLAACPISNSDSNYLGPAALTAAYRFNIDSRDQGKDKRLAIVSSPEGCWRCHFAAECSEACPKDVDPAYAIQKLKVESAIYEIKRLFTGKKEEK